MLLTVYEADQRINKLEEEIDYLTILTDKVEREEREICLPSPPASIFSVLAKEMDARKREYDHLKNTLDDHMRCTKLDFGSVKEGK